MDRALTRKCYIPAPCRVELSDVLTRSHSLASCSQDIPLKTVVHAAVVCGVWVDAVDATSATTEPGNNGSRVGDRTREDEDGMRFLISRRPAE